MTASSPSADLLATSESTPWWRLGPAVRFARTQRLGAVAGLFVLLFLVVATLAPWLTPHSPLRSIGPVLQSPNRTYFLGTDSLGRDVFSRVIQGSQVSLVVAATVILVQVTLSTFLGLVSGYFGGWIDYVIQRTGEAFHAFPGLILYFIIISAFGNPNATGGNILETAWQLRVLIFALSIPAFFGGSRIIRGAAIGLRNADFVASAQALGASDRRIIWNHLLPNVLPLVLVQASSAVSRIILAAAALDFLGLGVAPGTPSWGADLSGRNRSFFVQAPWLALAPGLAISLTVLAFNLFGDALRDYLDPRMRGIRKR